jgi:hypothetical protein
MRQLMVVLMTAALLGRGIAAGAAGPPPNTIGYAAPARDATTRLPDPLMPGTFGINISFTGEPKAELEQLKGADFRMIRTDLLWHQIERRRDVYDFRPYDALVAGLVRRSIKPVFVLDYGNPLYDSIRPPDGGHPGAILSPHTPEGWDAYARFCAAAVNHFRRRSVIWELWNAPNTFWAPQPNADDYANMALTAVKAMREADPECIIMAPGVAGIDLKFLERTFQRGLLEYLDAVSVQPFRDLAPETALPELHRLRQLIDRYAPAGTQLPVVCSGGGYSTATVPEDVQGKYLARQWLTNVLAGARLSIWYGWKDDTGDPKAKAYQYGTVRNDLQPKPAYQAARTLNKELLGCRFQKRLDLGRPEDFGLLFTRGEQQILVFWTTDTPRDILLPRSASLKGVTDWQGGQIPVPTSSTAAARVHLSEGPQYVRLKTPSEDLALIGAWTTSLDSTCVDGATSDAVRLTIQVRNPTSRRLPFAAKVQPPTNLEGSWVTPLPAYLEPKTKLQLHWVGRWGLRADEEVTVPVSIRLGPASGRDTVAFEVRNGLRPEFRWRANGGDLLVQNRSGTPLTGELRLTAGGQTVQRPIRLAAGETSTRVSLDGVGQGPLSGGLYDVRGAFLAPIQVRTTETPDDLPPPPPQ